MSNSVFLGPIDLELNAQYNALIGGRGTGKSTILEYLRWALCDQPPGIADDDVPNYQARRSRLIEQTLKPVKATVQVRFELNGVPHFVRRNSEDGSVLIKIGTDELRQCTEDEVRSLLPIHAYSQKQLSDVSVRVDELTRFVTSPIRGQLASVDRQLTERAERLRQSHATYRRQRALSRVLNKRELEEKSLTEQAQKIRQSLTGISEEDRQLLDRGRLFDSANRAVRSWMNGAGTIRERAQGLRDAITVFTKQLPASPEEPEKKILEAAHGEYRTLLEEADTMLDGLTERATAIANATGTPWQEWDAKLAAFKTQYDAAVTRSSAHSEKMAQLKRVEEELAQHGLETARIRDELATLASVEAVYLEERKAWEMLLADRAKLLEAQCKRLTESSANAIRARVKTHADAMDFVSSLRQALSGSRVPTSKVEALGQAIVDSANPAAQWSAVLSNLEKLAEFDPDSEASDQRPETPTLSAAGLSAADLDRIARALKPEHWIEISLTPIRSVPLFEYRAREGEYIPFKNASAGQQATALLKTLLSESGPPLIIDQPEEDLDNPVILEVVELVWNAKQRRQLLFTSHNANLVVNGDAELVAWCDYRTAGDQSGGTIAGEGAIDVPQVREAIKRIMEGGEAAFALRKEKYGF